MGGLTTALAAHRLVGLDTPVFIYHIEAVPRYAAVAGAVLFQLEQGAFEGVTSVLTLMELVVRPLQLGRPEVADEYDVLVASYPHLRIAQIDRTIARQAAELRAAHRLRPADSLQVAACLHYGATAFVTNDRALQRVPALDVLILDDFLDG